MRGRRARKHTIYPDARYQSEKVARFINYVMLHGKKNTAERIVYDTFNEIQKRTGQDPLEVFEAALKNVGPVVEVRSRRVGGANYQVPREVRPERRTALAMRWILNVTRGAGKGKPMYQRLADELISASNNEGEAVQKRENVHKMAEANKAFAHFAF